MRIVHHVPGDGSGFERSTGHRVPLGAPSSRPGPQLAPTSVPEEPDDFEFVSSVSAAARKDVEALFYFHPRQHQLIGSIRGMVERYGQPQIQARGDRISLGIAQHGVQCLFACHRARRPGVPVGVVLYLRTEADALNILHVAVAPAYERHGAQGERALAMRLVAEVRAVARRVAGIRRVELPYSGGRSLPVVRGTPTL